MSTQRTSSWLVPLSVLVLMYFVWEWRNGKRTNAAPAELREVIEADVSQSKQKWFDHFHPIGKAKGVTVHHAERVNTSHGRQVNARFTIHWSGPVTTDGFTKIHAIYDGESRRWVRAEVLETNGITNNQAFEGIGVAIGALLSE